MSTEQVGTYGALILGALAAVGGVIKFVIYTLSKAGGADVVATLQAQITQLQDDLDEERRARERDRSDHRDEVAALHRQYREEVASLQREVRDLLRPHQNYGQS